jgi:adenosyl cobinamide kinase/adenosyl cobinamide phosphate guanylyltransferase
VIFIQGGACSGKSKFAVDVAVAAESRLAAGRKVGFVSPLERARAAPALQERMDAQRSQRPRHWAQQDGAFQIDELANWCSANTIGLLVFDGLNLWLGNEITLKGESYAPPLLESHCRKEMHALAGILGHELAKRGVWTIVCSGIVNEGLPAVHESGRLMREILSASACTLAAQAEVVCSMESGLARAIKYPARLRNEVFPGVRDVWPVIMMEPEFVGRIWVQRH